MRKFKKGAASFYIVAFSTLILLIIAASFAAVIISEITRTSNDDLAQSAYDSALAGVEDAKLAFYNYRNCKAKNNSECDTVLEAMENADCNMVSRMLFKEDGEVLIEESTVENRGNNMSQAYTCVKIDKDLPDYRGSSSPSEPIKVIRAKFSSYEENGKEVSVHASMIKRVKISWYSVENLTASGFNPANATVSGVIFDGLSSETSLSTPPTISFALVQAGSSFNIDDFDKTKGDRTNRGMIYLVPSQDAALASSTKSENNYNGTTYDKTNKTNTIKASALAKSNDKVTNNKPYMVYCDPKFESEFACSATIDLPKPVNGERDDENFYIVIGFPYSNLATDYALEFFCDDICMVETETLEDENGNTVTETQKTNQANLDSVQIEVDSTGRANDMYRRVKARLENPDNFMSVMGPLELLGDGNSDGEGLLNKTEPVICEWNFPNRGC